jgi:hypothetical protein
MKKYYLLLLLICFFFSCNQNQKVDTVSLFNGNNLEGWIIYGTEKWYVDNNELICESGPEKGYGYLATEKFYDNFILTLEFNQESDGNSGFSIGIKMPKRIRRYTNFIFSK